MSEPSTDSEVSVTFYPQEWVDSIGEAHDRDKRRLVPAPDRDPVSFTVPEADATDDTGTVVADESYEANLLQSHPSAPDWVRSWDGPYYVRTDEPDDGDE